MVDRDRVISREEGPVVKDPNKIREVGKVEDENDFTAGPWGAPGTTFPSNSKKPKS